MGDLLKRRSGGDTAIGRRIFARALALAVVIVVCMPVATRSSSRRDNCFLAPAGGDCENRLSLRVKYFYDSANDDCKEFIYFGCGGNGNRFDTFEECESVCMYFTEY